MSIKRSRKESCINFTNTCPWSYNSTEQFKYPGCYEVGKTEQDENQNHNMTTTKITSTNGEIIAGVFVAVTCIVLFFLIVYFLHARNKKKKNESYLEGNNPNIAEAQPINKSNFSAANIDNVATAGNQISRDQTEYSIPVSQDPINTVDDNYIGQFIPTSPPSSVAQQETSTDQAGETLTLVTFSPTSSSTAAEVSHLNNARDISTGDEPVNSLFTELDITAGTIPYEDISATSPLQDPDMIAIGGSVSDIIDEVKKVLDDAKSRLDGSVRKTCKKKLKEAEKTHQKELDMIRNQIEAENRKLKRQISEQQKQLSHKDRKISRQNRDIEEKDRQITDIARQLQESQSQTNVIKDKLKAKERELVEMRKEISRLNDEIIKLER